MEEQNEMETSELQQSLINDPMHPYGKPCNVCSSEYDDDEWGLMGWVGIIPVSLCAICSNALASVVLTQTPTDELEELIAMRKMEEDSE